MAGYADVEDANEFAAYLEAAKEYDGFEQGEDGEEDDSEGTGEDQDADAGEEGHEGDEDEDAEEPQEDTEDEASFEVTLPGGQKVTVPLSELVAGYSRQQDYTRKTQALAAERHRLADAQAIAQALERNPQAAIEALARAYGVGGAAPEEQDYLSEEQQWQRSVEARFQAQDRAQREAALNSELARLHTVYGDFNEENLFNQALATNTMNLEIVLRSMVLDTVTQQQQARTQRSTKAANGKRAAAAAPPASRNGTGSVPVVEEGEINSFRDAYKYASRVLNRS